MRQKGVFLNLVTIDVLRQRPCRVQETPMKWSGTKTDGLFVNGLLYLFEPRVDQSLASGETVLGVLNEQFPD